LVVVGLAVVLAGLVDVVLTVVLLEGLTVVFEVTGLLVVVVLDVLVVVGLTVVFIVAGLPIDVVVLAGFLVVVVEAVGFLVVWASCFAPHKITVRKIILNYRVRFKLGATKQFSTKRRNSQTTYRSDSQEDDNRKEENWKELHFLSRRYGGVMNPTTKWVVFYTPAGSNFLYRYLATRNRKNLAVKGPQSLGA
jgi:hypothetical protein